MRSPHLPPSPIILELRAIRKELHLPCRVLALRMNLRSATQLTDWENGVYSPRFATLERWADALGYELDLHQKEPPQCPNTKHSVEPSQEVKLTAS